MAYASSAEILIFWRNNNKHFSSEVLQKKSITVKDSEKKIGNAGLQQVLELLTGDEKKAFEAQSKGFTFGKFGGRKANTNWKEDRTVTFQKKTGSVVLSSLPAFFGVKKENFEDTSLIVHFDEKNKTVVISLME